MEKQYLNAILGEKMQAVATDETTDRHQEKIKIDGWDLKNYKKNPVLQWAHDYTIPPIGRATKLRFENNKLLFEPEFHEETELARQVKKLFLSDPPFLQAFSVGFIPKDMEGNVIKEAELLEISAVPVPSNPNALVFAKSKGLTEVAKWLEPKKKSGRVLSAKNVSLIKSAINALNALLEANEKPKEEPDKDKPKEEDKKQIIYKGREKEQNNDVVIKKALQKIARQSNFALNKIKKG